MLIELFSVADEDRIREALAIRQRVFVDEQGVPLDEEIDEHDLTDPDAVHALARADSVAIGTGRFYPLVAGGVQIGRMAVLAEARRAGVGRAILNALIAEAMRRGFRRGALLAQVDATAFYERAGFGACGACVWDAGILHQPMERALDP